MCTLSWEEGYLILSLLIRTLETQALLLPMGNLDVLGRKRDSDLETHNLSHDEILLFPKFLCGKLRGTRLWLEHPPCIWAVDAETKECSGKSNPTSHLGKAVFSIYIPAMALVFGSAFLPPRLPSPRTRVCAVHLAGRVNLQQR